MNLFSLALVQCVASTAGTAAARALETCQKTSNNPDCVACNPGGTESQPASCQLASQQASNLPRLSSMQGGRAVARAAQPAAQPRPAAHSACMQPGSLLAAPAALSCALPNPLRHPTLHSLCAQMARAPAAGVRWSSSH